MTRTLITGAFLGADACIPLDRPFLRREIEGEVGRRRLESWLEQGLIVSPLRGVLHAAQLPDGLDLRLACLKLVVPSDCVVTDRTAAWLHGAPMVLAPNDHLRIPTVDMFRSPGNRLRRECTASGERSFLDDEVVEIDGLRVTTKLRTACDLGMRLPRTHAFAAMCSMMTVADFPQSALLALAGSRFVGYRWVRQLKSLAPHVDGRFQSPGECALALRWLDHGSLPPYEPQLEVAGPHGSFFLDLAAIGLPYGAEYDGPKWHGPDREEADTERREWLARERGWVIDVFTKAHVYGPCANASDLLMAGVIRARRRYGATSWTGQDRTILL
jgi:hypothetical protein